MDTHEFIAAHKITAEAERAESNPNMEHFREAEVFQGGGAEMDHWRVLLQRPGKRMGVYFSMGLGHAGKAPEAADVLSCLAMDSLAVDNADTFEEWAKEMGYDTDSRRAHRSFMISKRQSERLRKFLGEDAYKQLLYDTEPL